MKKYEKENKKIVSQSHYESTNVNYHLSQIAEENEKTFARIRI